MGIYYLSDGSFGNLKRKAKGEAIGTYVEGAVREWIKREVVLPKDVVELIEGRREEKARKASRSSVERRDRRRVTVGASERYDGVVWQAVFGGWERRPHEIQVSVGVETALADWYEKQGVVTRRAASLRTLCGYALELIGRGWISD